MLLSVCLALLLQGGPADLPVVAAKDLKSVPGPMTLESTDPAGRPLHRDISAGIRRQLRRTPPRALQVPVGDAVVEDAVPDESGWRLYRVDLPPGTRMHVRLNGDHEGWFFLKAVNAQGNLGEGLLRNLIATGNPEVTCDNARKTVYPVYVVVDTTERSIMREPYRLTFRFKPL